jgi:MFS family permease
MAKRNFWRNLTIIFGGVTGVMAGAALSPALPGMAEHFQDLPNGEFLVRLSLTLPALFIAITAPFVGGILDRTGRKPILIASLVLFGIAGGAGYLIPTLSGILISRAFVGIAVAGLVTGFTTLIADNFEGAELNKYMGFQGAAMGIGGVLFLLLSGYLADISWRLPFLMYPLAFAFLPGLLWAVDEPKLVRAASEQNSLEKTESFPLKSLLPIYLLTALTIIIFFIFSIQLPFLLTADFGVSNSLVGLALALQTLSSIFAALLYRRLRERFSFAGILVLMFIALGINHAFTLFGGSYLAVVTGLLIGGIGLGLTPPNFNVWINSLVTDSQRGRALSGFTSALFLGQFLTPIAVQLIDQRYGGRAVFSFGMWLSLVLVLLLMWWSRRKRAAR